MLGILIAHAAGERDPGRRALWAAAAVAPDVDGLAGLAGRSAYYQYHGVVLHNLLGVSLVALLCGAMFTRLGWGSWNRGTAIAALAVASHLILDAATSLGPALCFPFTRTRTHWDLLFLVDAAFSAILVTFACLSWGPGARRRMWGRIGLALLAAYVGIAAICRGAVEASVRAGQASGHLPPGAIDVLPQPPGLGSWVAFVTTTNATWAGRVGIGSLQGGELKPYQAPARDRLFAAALATPAVQRFLAFARFPHVSRTDTSDGSIFEFEDLRFSFSGWERSNWWYGVRVDVERHGIVRHAGFANP
jgi:membrane-bound metal-dependent hydrolase YbcI (DUF457 family)